MRGVDLDTAEACLLGQSGRRGKFRGDAKYLVFRQFAAVKARKIKRA